MGAPAHDSHDYEFALKYDLPIKCVVKPDDESCAESGEGTMINSSSTASGLDINGLARKEAGSKVIEWAEKTANGKKKVLFSVYLNFNVARSFYAGNREWG